jgi:hypothetical protein
LSARRLPAYAGEVAQLLREGRRPRRGLIVVSTEWRFVSGPFVCVVCPRDTPPSTFDFAFLRGQDVLVLVPTADAPIGEQILEQIRAARPKHVMLWTFSGSNAGDAA